MGAWTAPSRPGQRRHLAIKHLRHRPSYTRDTAEITSTMAMIAGPRRRMFESREKLALREQTRTALEHTLGISRIPRSRPPSENRIA
jgi:hypothetical protein